ncbi:RNA polymerase sigma factor [Jannaschia marina]|uniref:RNA polymerase sigma factor n=1 Tax=Jannaschia marina TaxID=2741674 RepID=UPI002E2B3FD9|nr:RNA polymerase sigma factor [Jannaschia marina]
MFGKRSSEREIRAGLPVLYPRLWRFALILSSSRDAADDLAQATCLRALDKAAGYTPGTRLDSWLFKMAQRIWLNELRSQAVRRGGGLQPVEDIALPDPGPGAETNILVGQVLSRISALPEAQRASVTLVYVEGFSYAEAAEILEVPIGTIMSRLSTARRKVSEAMEDAKTGTS